MGAERVRIGIIGAGANTREVHIPKLREIDGVEIVAVANRSRASGAEVASRFGIPRVLDRWQDLAADPGVDAVLVGTWPNLHREAAVAALEAGKHVLCEARMAMDASEAREMLAASRAHPGQVAQLVPAPYTLELDAAVKRLLAEGWLGRLLVVDVRATTAQFVDETSPLHWRQDASKSGLNTLALGIWYESVSRWIGRAASVLASARTCVPRRTDPSTGRTADVKVPDHVDVLAETAQGASLRMQASAVTGLAPSPREAWLFGSEGTLRVDADTRRLYGARRGEAEMREIVVPPEERIGWRVEREFVGAIRGEEAVRLTTFAEGVRYMEFTEAVALAARTGRRVEIARARSIAA
jgi:predicted dehydrogenase